VLVYQAEAESREAEEMRCKLSKHDDKSCSSSLTSLIRRNQQSRGQQMDAFFDDLAAKYSGKSAGKKQFKTAAKSSAKSKAKK